MEKLRAELEDLHPKSFAWACRCCNGDRQDAEDILQTAYEKVISGKARFRGRSTVKTWFFGVIRLTALELIRVRRRQQKCRDALRREEPERLAQSPPCPDPRIEQISRLLTLLPDRQREALHLVCREELTVEETAAVMGVSIGTARQHYHRAKEKIRTLLQEETDEPGT